MMDKVSIKAPTPKVEKPAVQPKPAERRAEVGVIRTTERWAVIAPDGSQIGLVSSKKEQAELLREWRESL